MILLILIILLLFSGGFGIYGGSRFGLAGYSPLGLILIILLVYLLLGNRF